MPVGMKSVARYGHILRKRIETVFRAASYAKADSLILGAFGCGVFGNSPGTVAETFRKVQQGYMRHFSSIEYAVYAEDDDDQNLRAFRAVLGS